MGELQPATNDLTVVVIGGSIGGLTAAVLLHESGYDVTVLERSPGALEGRGAGIVLHEATARYLVEKAGMNLDSMSKGASWFRFLDRDSNITYEAPCLYRFTAWNTLYSNLLDHLPGDRYRYGKEVVSLEPTAGQVQVVTDDGETTPADLVICADGISSAARRQLLPEVEVQYSGYLGWRGVVRDSELDRATFDRLYEAITYSTPPFSHILAYPIPGHSPGPAERILNYVWYRNLAPGPALDDALTDVDGRRRPMSVAPGRVQERHIASLCKEAQEQLPTDLAEMVLATADPFIQTVVDVEVPKMVFGRVCLIGDAAFAARPHAAAGTAKAAADAWGLATALESAGGDLDSALSSWEVGALRRGSQLTARARTLGTMAQVHQTFRPDDPYILFGLDQPGDSCYPAPSAGPTR